MESFKKKRVLVVGLGKSGLSSCRWLSSNGAEVTLSEIRAREDLDRGLVDEVETLGVALETGGHSRETFLRSEMIVVSPGVPLDMEPLRAAGEKGIPVLGEMELAGRLIRTPMVAVTGTNGKSTVTSLIGDMLKRAGLRVFVGGNIGTPLMDLVLGGEEADVAVVEVSSFQLDTMDTFRPAVAMVLNISPDHLDRYPDYGAYVASKLRIFRNQGPGHFAILNDEDDALRGFTPAEGVSVLRYGLVRMEGRQAFMEGGRIKVALPGERTLEFNPEKFRLPGGHNLENLMACILAGLALRADPSALQDAIEGFSGLSHRMEFVRRVGGIDFYNDSKATNVDAAAKAVGGFNKPVILIAGGRDKGGDYSPLVEASMGRVKMAIFLGEARDLLAGAFSGKIPFSLAEDMPGAVAAAFASGRPDDVVLLAPACSSFDMFSDYGHRGRVFREAVEGLDHG